MGNLSTKLLVSLLWNSSRITLSRYPNGVYKMTKPEAVEIILSDTKSFKTSLNYAVNYCYASRGMLPTSREFGVQILYILNNITHWRHPQAKEVRQTLRRKE